MNPITSRILWMILGRTVTNVLIAEGKTEEAGLLGDILAAVRAKKNIDADLMILAEKWAEQGEPPLDSIVSARKAIQAQL